ncbi:MAG: hypothetical protein A3H51_00035 [Candidatus Spechtbacteria bacterium RIFCSPLOWO2_02_FULL_38_8]|uniref:Uncharacterized protein n=1 Tax=Candidatus Spechtbacteria bacterium RIFCSPLOWO2_02_FULL_38_8 TaxID=1802164 RepID=A0A1G2HHP5_9BACT|nr:MAG: hypothetical protein A3H51_00035 [Candidatus Spechtbacteria bacterium RIFCSPLOWO2_02_FULL_38_8]
MGTKTGKSSTTTTWKNVLFNPRVIVEFDVERDFGKNSANHRKLIEVLKEVDCRFPWIDRFGQKRGGIHNIKSEFVEESVDFGPRVLVSFEPYDLRLGRGQLIAYYNYAVNLGQVISMMRVENVDSLSVKIDFLGIFNFFKSRQSDF